MSKEPKKKPSLSTSRGIPSLNRTEKLTEVIPVKVGSSLKRAIPKPQSSWIRRAIIEKLQRIDEAETLE